MAQLADNRALLIYRVGPVLCCAPALCVTTLIRPPPLTHPPSSSNSRPGIFRHDGQLVSLIELRHLFGVAQQDRKQPGRIIICQFADQHIGFLVDEVIDIMASPGHGWGQISLSLSGGIFSRSLLLDEKIYLYCEFEKLPMIRHHGFLKPWIQQLHEQNQTREDSPVQTTASTTVISRTPLPEKTDMLSDNITPPPTTPSAAFSKLRSRPSVSQTKPRSPQVGHREDNRKHKYAATIRTNKNQQTTTRADPGHSITPPSRRPPASRVMKTRRPYSSPSTASHPAADRFDLKTHGAGANWQMMVIIALIGVGLISTLFYLWPNYSINPTIKPAVDTFATEVPTVAEAAPPLENKPSHKIPTIVADDEIEDMRTTASHDGPEKETRYHATIEQRRNEVTIILTAPATDTVIRTNTDKQVIQGPPAKIRSVLKPAPAVSSQPSRQRIDEVVHTVIKGDTLWHIARRYIHNPFRYPELARLNNIQNPNLIYPGDRVRIIRIYRQSVAPDSAN